MHFKRAVQISLASAACLHAADHQAYIHTYMGKVMARAPQAGYLEQHPEKKLNFL